MNTSFFDGYGNKLQIQDKAAFLKAYWNVKCFHQEDSKKSEGELNECWAITTYLITSINSGMLKLPIEIEKRESPDFSLLESGRTFGVEVVSMTTNLYKAATSIARNSGKDYLIELSDFQNKHENKFAGEEIKRVLKNADEALSGAGFQGHAPFYEAARLFQKALLSKLILLNSGVYNDLIDIELIVRNDSHIFLGRDWIKVGPFLKDAMKEVREQAPTIKYFSKVHFLFSDKIIYDIEGSGSLLIRGYKEGENPNI